MIRIAIQLVQADGSKLSKSFDKIDESKSEFVDEGTVSDTAVQNFVTLYARCVPSAVSANYTLYTYKTGTVSPT